MSTLPRLGLSCLLAASLAGLAACGSDNGPKPTDAGVPDAPQGPVVGGKLGQAIASAAAASTAAPTAKGQNKDDGPPENGIFAPGEADKRQAKDAPPKIDVISEGEGTKVTLAPKLDAAEQKVTLNVGLRLGQTMVPNIDYALAIKPDKAPAKDAPAGAPARMAATVTGTTLPPGSGLPKEMADMVTNLKGTIIRFDLAPHGGTSNFAVELPKGAGNELGTVMDGVVSALGLLSVPVPNKPVGKGAYWIAQDRTKVTIGIETVRYRVFTVQSIDGDTVTLGVDIRQYSAAQTLSLDSGTGQKADMGLGAFDSQGKGTVVWKADTFLPAKGQIQEALAARLNVPGQQPGGRNAPVVQTQIIALTGGGMPEAPAGSATPGATAAPSAAPTAAPSASPTAAPRKP